MFRNGYDMMVTKYSADAIKEMADSAKRVVEHNRQMAQVAQLIRITKLALMFLAVAGVGTGLYFARDLGGMAANMSSSEPDPTLIGTPSETKAKVQRKMAEIRRQQESDLDEIQGGGSQDNGDAYKMPEKTTGKGAISGMRKKQIEALDDIQGGDSQDKDPEVDAKGRRKLPE